ncbi:RNA methyltransferase tRNA(m5U54)methyltransferase [Coemansia biformis]|uniref:tRNA (guanine(26)-N(2))-dimethyltransferase n=1 Tax=Coemansia biformis TaxID=1286918 RepID=A0A9W7YJH7_9FUNG|nr:RNA methyltransferase tRNA(m5U54)methyltransferase [Coemansia biformis]
MADEHAPAAYAVEDYQQITEGQATILFPKNNEVFYNPVQEFNRDMSIAAIKTWRDVTMEARMARFARSESPKKVAPPTTFTILEALAASGLRSVRYAKEIEGIDHIVANDLLEDAAESIRRNAHYNAVSPQLLRANRGDAITFMYAQRDQKRFDVVDLDPYGSAAPFIDGAIHAAARGGLLCVTCTDLAILASNKDPETCYAKYSGNPLRSEFCHELALRLVIHSLQQAANRQRRYIEPLLSCSIDFYVRVFVRVHDSPLMVKSVASQSGPVYHCGYCGSYAAQPLGAIVQGSGSNLKYRVARGPPVDRTCANCNSALEIGGPCWLGPLHNRDFVQRMYDGVSKAGASVYGTQPRMKGMLKVILEELEDAPFHYTISKLSAAVRTTCPPLVKVNSALLNAGFRVSGSHTAQGSIKTDAPPAAVWDVMRALVHEAGRSPRIQPGSPAEKILEKDIATAVSFATHKDATPESRRISLVRYQVNPEKFWGPKARHTEAPKEKRKQPPNHGQHPSDADAAIAPDSADAADADMDTDAKKPKTDRVDMPVAAGANVAIDAAAAEIGALCDSVESIAGSVVAAQAEKLVISSDSEQRLVNRVTSTFVRLRQLHRQLSEDKAALAASVDGLKQGTDSLALQLENKLREVAYIQREIESTNTLETIYQDIDLIPKEEFLAAAPDEYRTDIDTPHKLMLARLRYEIRQRDILVEARDRARAQRDELREAKRRRIERLEKVDGHLQSYVKSASLLGKTLSVGIGAGDGSAAVPPSDAPGDDAKAAAGDGDEDRKGPDTPRPTRGDSSRAGTPRV